MLKLLGPKDRRSVFMNVELKKLWQVQNKCKKEIVDSLGVINLFDSKYLVTSVYETLEKGVKYAQT